jgi:hypothetical protein
VGCIFLLCLFSVFVFPFGVWVAAVDAFGAADRLRAGAEEGGFILRYECMSRVIKFDSKQNKKIPHRLLPMSLVVFLHWLSNRVVTAP